MLKTILFDIGGTLIDNESWKSTVDRAAYKAMIDFGFNIGAEEFAEAFSRAVNDYDQVNNKSQKMHGGMDFVMSIVFSIQSLKMPLKSFNVILGSVE